LNDPDPRIEPLEEHDRAAFSCGEESLDRYIREQAGQDRRGNFASVFVLCYPDSPAILGYYTLSTFSVLMTEVPEALRKGLRRYDEVPAILIGRLAVDEKYKGKRYGETLLFNALRRSLTHSAQIAAAAVVVDALNVSAQAFYEKYGFQSLLERERRLFLSMKTIQKLLGHLPEA
jgi:ribosomal protein S18 acetylase RimI-like enzyme